jgi:hypothetical protein
MKNKVTKTAIVGLAFVGLIAILIIKSNSPAIPSNWQMIDAGVFYISAPPDWKFKPFHAIDSYAGEIVGDDTKLISDFGYWTGSCAEEKDVAYARTYKLIDGHWAKVAASKTPGKGYTTVFFGHLPKNCKFSMRGENLSSFQQEIALKIFNTIKFKRVTFP